MSSDEDEIINDELDSEYALDLRVSSASYTIKKDSRSKNDNFGHMKDGLTGMKEHAVTNINTNYLFQHFQKLLSNYSNNEHVTKNGRYGYSASSSSSPPTPPSLMVPPIPSPPMSRRSSNDNGSMKMNNIPVNSFDPYKHYYYYLLQQPSLANNHVVEMMTEHYHNLLTASSAPASPLPLFHDTRHPNHVQLNHNQHVHRQSLHAFRNEHEYKLLANQQLNELHMLEKLKSSAYLNGDKINLMKNGQNGVNVDDEDELVHGDDNDDEDELENDNALDLSVSNLALPMKKDCRTPANFNKHYLLQHFQKYLHKRSNAGNGKDENHMYRPPHSPSQFHKYSMTRVAEAMADNYNNLLSSKTPPLPLQTHNSKHPSYALNARLFRNDLKNDLKDLPYPHYYTDDNKTELRSADTTKQGLSDLNGERKRISRPLTGRHVRQGTGASPSTLVSLRQMIQDRQRLKELGVSSGQGKVRRRNNRRK